MCIYLDDNLEINNLCNNYQNKMNGINVEINQTISVDVDNSSNNGTSILDIIRMKQNDMIDQIIIDSLDKEETMD